MNKSLTQRAVVSLVLFFIGLPATADPRAQQEIEKVLNAPAEIAREGTVVTFRGFLTPDNASRLIAELEGTDVQRLRVTSGGGYVTAALDIAKRIAELKLDVEVSSLCASSCANYLFVAGRKRHILPGAIVMWHGGADQKDFREFRECRREVSSFSGSRREVNDEDIKESRSIADRERALYSELGISSLLTRTGQEPTFLGRNVTHSVKDMELLGLKVVAAEQDYGQPSFCRRVHSERPSLGLVCLPITPQMIAYERARVALGEECRPDGTLQIRTRRRAQVDTPSTRPAGN